MNALNPALIIAGPALIVFKGKALWSKENIPLNIREETVELQSSAYGKVADVELSKLLEVSFVPTGQLNALAELYPTHLREFIPGRLVHHARTLGTIVIAEEEVDSSITISNHGFRDGAQVRVTTYGALPAGLSGTTLYYVHSIDANTISLHLTESAALAGTAPVEITTAGTGTHRIIEQEQLLIWSLNEQKGYIFHNAAVTKMPGIKGSTTESALKDVTFTLYRKHGIDPTDAAAFYTATNTPPASATFNPDEIITGFYDLSWGEVAPWSALSTREGVDIEFPMDLTPVPDQAAGIVSHRVTGVRASVTVSPTNVDETHIFAKRTMQGAGAGSGRRLAGDDFIIEGDDLYIAVYNAVLKGDSTINYDGTLDRVGALTFESTRKFTAGVPDPIFYIGAEEPA